MNKISDSDESLAKYFVELFTSDDNDFIESDEGDIYFEPKKDNILVNLTGFRDTRLFCEFTVKVESVDNKHVVSFEFNKNSKGEDPDNLGINDKSVLKKYKELDRLFYAAFENRKFELTSDDLKIINNLSKDKNLNIIELMDQSSISSKFMSDLKAYINDINECMAYADKNYDKLMSVFNDKISDNDESLVKYFVELFTADDSLYVESEKAYITSTSIKDNILIKVQGFRGADISLCEFTVKVKTTNNKNIVSFIFDKESKFNKINNFGETPDKSRITDKSVLKTYNELDSLFYGAFKNKKFEFTLNDLKIMKKLFDIESLDIYTIIELESNISSKFKSDIKLYVNDINKCMRYADKNYDKLMSVFQDMSMER